MSLLRRLGSGPRLLLLLSLAVLLLYGGRTYLRNFDWINEEALFVSALKVCMPVCACVCASAFLCLCLHSALCSCPLPSPLLFHAVLWIWIWT